MSTVSSGPAPHSNPQQAANGTTGAAPSWKLELHQKLAASRARRGGLADGRAQTAGDSARPQHGINGGRASLAAAVAARYSTLPSYRETLAQEAEAAAQAAEEAAIHAHQAAEAVYQQIEQSRALERAAQEQRETAAREAQRLAEQPAVKLALGSAYPTAHGSDRSQSSRASCRPRSRSHNRFHPALPMLTDPIEAVLVTPTVPLAANLIEFPRSW